ncbi:hypothetical protein VCR14J2_610038 [Vibrio coralliirubri]|uniref:Uncharacterized protein n=1 Tax=Vibrio coralliirubri TaxID=1516159 RepID=A0AA86X923_9VIBR|nr:hypothetical protein VCR31J2_1270038 [Vibrio coralliirubri]CDT66506.1 hypothetical protein VCR26J2_350039 [Vibrio coralliirubri]CDU06840.1 hypothetical protein VCR12J2_90038 [Vibrio coralliirubri]CDU07935.1 hypothetical protein VCR14J2_610038 [Vibrio coralliirubri]
MISNYNIELQARSVFLYTPYLIIIIRNLNDSSRLATCYASVRRI